MLLLASRYFQWNRGVGFFVFFFRQKRFAQSNFGCCNWQKWLCDELKCGIAAAFCGKANLLPQRREIVSHDALTERRKKGKLQLEVLQVSEGETHQQQNSPHLNVSCCGFYTTASRILFSLQAFVSWREQNQVVEHGLVLQDELVQLVNHSSAFISKTGIMQNQFCYFRAVCWM